MKNIVLFLFLAIPIVINAQENISGTWQAIDDKDGEPSSYIQIQETNGTLTGTVVKIFDVDEGALCELCKGDKKNQPVLGMNILYNMKKNGKSWSGGKILDPENGKDYKCKIHLEDANTMKVRGYIGIPALGRTQTWYRVQD